MYEFYSEISDRKRTASGSRHMKRGSKSKKCPLPSDGMTQKQWKERNGAVNSYNFNKPMTWEEFISASIHIQQDYLNYIISKFNANSTNIAHMLNVSPLTIRKHISENQIPISFKVGHKMSKEQKEAWDMYLSEQTEGKAAGTTMDGFSFTFNGKIDALMIANSIINVLGNEANGRIEISYCAS